MLSGSQLLTASIGNDNLVYFGLRKNEGAVRNDTFLNICAQRIDKEHVDTVFVSAHQSIRNIRSFRKNSEICSVEIPPQVQERFPESR